MKLDYDSKLYKGTIYLILAALAMFLLSQLHFIINPLIKAIKIVFFPVLFASFFYYIFRPPIRLMEKIKIKRVFGIIIIIVLIIGILGLLSIFSGRYIEREFSAFSETFSKQVENLQEYANEIMSKDEIWIFSVEDLEDKATNAIKSGVDKVAENITGWISNISDVVTYIILIPITIFFLLKDDKLFFKIISKKIPEKNRESIKELFGKIDTLLSSYFTGQIIVAFFLGIITYIGYLIIGIPNALILAAFSMVMSIIPFIGPILGVIPAILIGWTVGFIMVLKAIVVVIIAQQLEGNLISPNIMGKRLKIHPLGVIFVVITGLTLFGFMGAFFAVPFYAVIREVYRHSTKKQAS